MLGTKGRQEKRLFSKAQVHFPTIQTLVDKMKKTGGRARSCFRQHGKYICMAVGKPRNVPDDMAQKLVKHLKGRSHTEVRQLLEADGVIAPAGAGEGGHKVVCKQFHTLFNGWCLINTDDFRCTCWRFRWRGSCPHDACMEYLEVRTWTPQILPTADEVQEQLDMAEDSAEEMPEVGPSPAPCARQAQVAEHREGDAMPIVTAIVRRKGKRRGWAWDP